MSELIEINELNSDKDKLLYYSDQIKSIVEPVLSSQKAKTILVAFNTFIDGLCSDINKL